MLDFIKMTAIAIACVLVTSLILVGVILIGTCLFYAYKLAWKIVKHICGEIENTYYKLSSKISKNWK